MKTFQCPLSLLLSDVLSLSLFFLPSPAMEQSRSASRSHFPVFLCIVLSHCPLIYPGTTALHQLSPTFFFFYLRHLFIQPPDSYLYLFFTDFSVPASLITFHLFTFPLSLTQSRRLWCAPRPAFVLNLWKFMRRASSHCITGWKCW